MPRPRPGALRTSAAPACSASSPRDGPRPGGSWRRSSAPAPTSLPRQPPEGRAEARRLREAILRARPDDRAALRELGGWWLGEVRDPDARRHAASALRRAAAGPSPDPSAAVLLALLTSDP